MVQEKKIRVKNANGESILISAKDSKQWQGKGYHYAGGGSIDLTSKEDEKKKEEAEAEYERVTEDPKVTFLKGWNVRRLRRVAADMGVSEANLLPKLELIHALLRTDWEPPEVEEE